MFSSSLIQLTFVGTSGREFVRSCQRARRAAITFALFLQCPAVALAQASSGPCGDAAKQSGTFLHCIAGAVDAAAKNHDLGALLKDPLQGYLRQLEAMVGYIGDPADLAVMKRTSLDLKHDASVNSDAIISLLDSAIASNAAELRPALSRETAAIGIDRGTDIYPRFVEQRLKFLLDPEKVKFYEHGPFELSIKTSLANALESKYFLTKNDRDDNLLRQEVQALKEAQQILLRPPTNEPRQRMRLNGNLFWQASIFFALGDREHFGHALHELVEQNQDFGLESRDPGHVYIYKVFDLPFSITLDGVDANGKPNLTAEDPYILNRFYNPGQLALRVCGLINAAGQNGIQAFSDTIRDFSFNDFYVVVASGSDRDMLRQFGDLVTKSIAGGERGARRDKLLQEIGRNAAQLSHTMEDGAAACGVEKTLLDKVYAPIDFKFDIKHLETSGKYPEQLILGGSLNADQANKLAEFFNEAVFADPALRDQARKLGVGNLGVENVSFTARVRIE
jgi:hypothetical protein